MTSHQDPSASMHQKRREQLRQLEHDMRSHLGIVTMGVQALEAFREDADQFAELSRTIEEEGVKPLKQTIAQIMALALDEHE